MKQQRWWIREGKQEEEEPKEDATIKLAANQKRRNLDEEWFCEVKKK